MKPLLSKLLSFANAGMRSTFQERALGSLTPLVDAIPELAELAQAKSRTQLRHQV
jgi:hypothetical protein